jgi:serine/threonine-protein kinase RsbW
LSVDAQNETADTGCSQQPISLIIPCKAEHIGLCRLLAGVVGARSSLQAEDIADLKLVVTEACTCFLWGKEGDPSQGDESQGAHSPGALCVEFDVQPGWWELTVSDPEHRHHIPKESLCDPSDAGGLGLTIIRALADTVEHTDNETEGSVIRLVKRLDSRPAVSH